MITPSVTGTTSTKFFSSGADSSTTITHTVPVMANGKLLYFGTTRNFPPGAASVTAVNWNGQAFTSRMSAGINGGAIFIWELANPVAGVAGTITVTWDAPPNSSGSTVVNVKDAGAYDVTETANFSSTTTASITKSTTADSELCFNIVFDVNEQVISYGADQTEVSNLATGAFWHTVSSKIAATAGSVTMEDTFAHATDGGSGFIAIKGTEEFIPGPIIII